MERLFVACTPGLEHALAQEAKTLGSTRVVPGGVVVEGAIGIHRRANLWLRTASRVSLILAELENTADDFRRLASRLEPWRELGYGLEVAGPGVERALVDGARRQWRLRSSAEGPALSLLRSQGRIQLSVDTTGELLYRRGYREEVSRAPMRETLAAGTLLLAGYTGQERLWDPMCGSGTLVIEAAWLAVGRAPGLQRTFAFEAWPFTDTVAWEREKALARSAEHQPPCAIEGTDLNAGSLGTARRNARRAHALQWLELRRADAMQMERPEGPAGLVVANLPYGKRLHASDLPHLLTRLSRAIQRLAGWRYALLAGPGTALPELQPEKETPLINGGLRCTLLLGRIPGPG